jgi:mono/diheme cytochrome c family protein
VTGLKYSGQYGFAETWMYWPSTHMVQPAANALQCNDCHGSNGRLDWKALGYPGDPMVWGGRFQKK